MLLDYHRKEGPITVGGASLIASRSCEEGHNIELKGIGYHERSGSK